jgi:hypothetical protein
MWMLTPDIGIASIVAIGYLSRIIRLPLQRYKLYLIVSEMI